MIRYRYFKVSVNLFFYKTYSDTKVFKIKNNLTLVLLAIWFSLISLLLGWWGWGFSITRPFKSIRNTMEAIHINLTGGEDYTKEKDETQYDNKTNYIWNNLLRTTTDKIKKKEVEIIIEIQEEFEQEKKGEYSKNNIDFLIQNLRMVNVYSVSVNEIKDIFDAIQSFKRYDKS